MTNSAGTYNVNWQPHAGKNPEERDVDFSKLTLTLGIDVNK